MGFDLSQAFTAVQGLLASFLARLPYLVIAVLVYLAFHVTARLTRRAIRRLTEPFQIGDQREGWPAGGGPAPEARPEAWPVASRRAAIAAAGA